jgi:DnaJ-domain-containing protein 1
MADMGDASGFKDISASTGAMRNVAARSRHYANTAAAMQSRHQDFAASVAADTSDANGADDQRQYLNRFRRIGGAKGTTKGGSL